MKYKSESELYQRGSQFNMTPLIDVVFILIVFFMLICQFIVQENVPVEVPDACENAEMEIEDREPITVSVYASPEDAAGVTSYAVRARRFEPESVETAGGDITGKLAAEIREQAERRTNPVIHLRADKNLRYADVQPALSALARAGVSEVHLAAYATEQTHDEP